MIAPITNRKIASIEPEWATFRGFSLLFDNPGNNFSTINNKLIKLNAALDSPALAFYQGLSHASRLLNTEDMKEKYHFCYLPDNTYHLTIWDGFNDYNRSRLSISDSNEFSECLNQFPNSIPTANRFLELANFSQLVLRRYSIQLKFSHLENIENDGLVACLMPADASSEKELRQVEELRRDLYEAYSQTFETNLYYTYKPHITLGYFANGNLAESANSDIDSWNQIVAKAVNGLTILYNKISLYVFTDMISFYKER